MNEFRADLHCHSTCSDGSKTPKELISLAKSLGLSGLSITDHDTIEGYKEALPYAKELDIDLITGVEFSTVHNGESVHILCYRYPIDSPLIKSFCEKHQTRRTNRNRGILQRLKEEGMPITEEEMLATIHQDNQKHTIGRPHIAMAMVKKGYVISIQDAFKRYIGDDKSCYVSGDSFSTEETIDLIHQAQGLAIIAHPHLLEDGNLLQDMLKMPFDGIECFYAKFSPYQNQRWLDIAKKKNWLITGGSDYHGDIKPNLMLGNSFVDQATFNALKYHRS